MSKLTVSCVLCTMPLDKALFKNFKRELGMVVHGFNCNTCRHRHVDLCDFKAGIKYIINIPGIK